MAYDEGRFALVAEAASKWRPELDEAISEMERFYAHNFARLLADRHDLDEQAIASAVHEFFRRLRADILEAAKARREVLQERGRSLPE